MQHKFFIPILVFFIAIGVLLISLPRESPPLTPSEQKCSNFIPLSKNFSFLAEHGIYIGFTVKYHPNWEMKWEREDPELLEVALTPKEASENNPPILLISLRPLTMEMPHSLQNVTGYMISEYCSELLELNYISWNGIPASKIRCKLRDHPEAIFLGIQIVREKQIQNVSVPLFYSILYAATTKDFEIYLNQTEEMIACLEII
ncbi:MAG: hypothetical protein QW507_02200 [Candidatus Nanoarchaeia archaeon]|nr:hypothetical protein [Candidatus Haiyanarchaeum thermophilum]MCW1302776.1 hypothetical protein [Candidatus Haiyanarchaeum thermophilum]MCW1304126.1 hypothetical protein [Candidatus Haiyanarchaeum thermophilum]MCW1306637.1 hypothetical protein [Candidatus Haiyanarchaeum thermophilum]MCW1307407.1 hypothetical protein [Candidatus Haiyanarchaeum thermophilum]